MATDNAEPATDEQAMGRCHLRFGTAPGAYLAILPRTAGALPAIARVDTRVAFLGCIAALDSGICEECS